jgi:hypothetical protein
MHTKFYSENQSLETTGRQRHRGNLLLNQSLQRKFSAFFHFTTLFPLPFSFLSPKIPPPPPRVRLLPSWHLPANFPEV